MGVMAWLFGGAVRNLGTEEHIRKFWLPIQVALYGENIFFFLSKHNGVRQHVCETSLETTFSERNCLETMTKRTLVSAFIPALRL